MPVFLSARIVVGISIEEVMKAVEAPNLANVARD